MSALPSLDRTFLPTLADEQQLDLFPGWKPVVKTELAMLPEREELRHELISLFNPLAAVVGFADLLVEDGQLGDVDSRRARLIHEAGREMEKHLRRLLIRLSESSDLASPSREIAQAEAQALLSMGTRGRIMEAAAARIARR